MAYPSFVYAGLIWQWSSKVENPRPYEEDAAGIIRRREKGQKMAPDGQMRPWTVEEICAELRKCRWSPI